MKSLIYQLTKATEYPKLSHVMFISSV